jgi:hypothetical protein
MSGDRSLARWPMLALAPSTALWLILAGPVLSPPPVIPAAPVGTSALAGKSAAPAEAAAVRVGQPAPEIAGGPWINSGPLTLQALRGRVVLVEFWTYG